MSAKFTCDNPKDMQFTLTMTLTLGQWLEIAEPLKNTFWTPNRLYRAIMDMESQARKHFFLDDSDPTPATSKE